MNSSSRQGLIALIFFYISLMALPSQAAHIIGGVITYQCLGEGNYRFTMRLYRDCGGTGALFDSAPGAPFAGTVSIYEGNSSSEFTNVILPPPTIINVPPDVSNPCLDPPDDVCVEEGVYVFDVNLPVSSQSYHIVYQRCCRNDGIANIVSPEATGATYSIELRPAAQQACNSSPTFDDFPPIVICAGEEINFDHAASDPDGDVLTYSLCAPLDGGGTDQMNFETLGGVAPNPDAPPPFNEVNFVSPFYSAGSPISASPALSINPNTGFLDGVPNLIGRYVVGVCVEERRSGVLLSRVFRDFQFNVVECTPTVQADIAEDTIVIQAGEQFYVVNVCGANGVFFDNESFDQAVIGSDFRWEFDINGTTDTFTAWQPTVNFPGPGTYLGALYLIPGSTCADTALIEVNVFPGIDVDFDFAYDTCEAGPVTFTDLTVPGAGPGSISEWNWNFGDGNISPDQNPVHTYAVPGDLPVQLLVRDTNDCTGLHTENLPYFPVPELLLVSPSDFIGCQPAEIFFDNLSTPISDAYDITWTFGDGGTSGDISPTYIYEEVGTYDVSLDVVSPLGCQVDTFWNGLITVLPSPVADFSYTPTQPSNLVPTVTFTDESIDPVAWQWTFDDNGISIEQNPVFTFPDTGLQMVQLVVFHASGCPDTALQIIDVIPEVRYFLPNAFTPNGDGTNDGFRGNGVMEGATDFTLTIWNRYGEKLFETDDPDEAWNGRKDNIGNMSAQGVYMVVVNYIEPRGAIRVLRGFATLVK